MHLNMNDITASTEKAFACTDGFITAWSASVHVCERKTARGRSVCQLHANV